MKTAIEWLYNELSKNNTSTYSVIQKINKESSIWQQAKEMEKEQIIEAINCWCSDDNILTPEQYYNQTYKQETI